MSSKIFEEKPAAAPAQQMGGEKAKIEKQARQLAYDTRYQVKKEVGGKNVNAAVIKQLLMKQLAKSTAAPAIKARAKQMLLGEDYIGDTRDMASNSLANAMFKVFVEGVQKDAAPIQLDYLQELAENPDKKYKVRVTDKNTGNSYIRYATRDKITQLRANPNIQSVEMTEYGEPREGEKTRGETTAKAKAGRDWDGDGKKESPGKEYRGVVHNAIQRRKGEKADGQDTSGVKEGKDWDGDGKVESGAKEYRGVVHNAIQKKRGKKADGQDTSSVKEDFLGEFNEAGGKRITGKGVDNYAGGKNAVVKVFPDDGQQKVDRAGQTSSPGSMGIMAGYEVDGPVLTEKAVSQAQQRFMGMVYAAKQGKKAASPEVAKAAKGMSKKEARKFAKTKHKGLPVHKEECGSGDESKLKKGEGAISDVRELPTKINLAKNKLRSMGLKMSYEPEGEVVSDGYDSTYGRGERGEPKGTQRQNVDPEAWERSRKQWEKLQPDIFKPRTPQAKATKTSKTKTA